MGDRHPTIADVAHAAGVAVCTVGRAIRGRADVHPETAARIAAAARQIGYQRPTQLTPAQLADACARYRQGATLAALAAECGVDRGTIRRWLAAEGVTIHPKGRRTEVAARG